MPNLSEDLGALEPGEEIIKIIHYHIVALLPVIVSTAIIILASFYASSWVGLHTTQVEAVVPVSMVVTGLLLIDILMVVIFAVSVLLWRQNRIVLTSVHLLQVKQNGLFGRTLSKFTLDELQDVKGSRQGVFATIFNYGNLLIETAAARENFSFGPVANPLPTAELINDSHERFERAHTYERP